MQGSWISAVVQGGLNAFATSEQLKEHFKKQEDRAKAAGEHDTALMVSASKSIGRLNVARAGMYRQATSALAATRAKKRATQSSLSANAAATGTVGASATAAMQDISVKADKAISSIKYNLDVGEEALFARQADLLASTTGKLRGNSLEDVLGRMKTDQIVFGGFLSGFMGGGGGSTIGKQKPSDNAGYDDEGGKYGSTNINANNHGDDSSQYGESTYGSNMSGGD